MQATARAIKIVIMKLIKALLHPYILIASFCAILISGEHLGGFYLLYLLLALPSGGWHAILGFAGIGLLVFGTAGKAFLKSDRIQAVFNLVGVCMLISSLVMFFYKDVQGYNYGTFYQTVPLISLIIFSLLSIGFIVKQIIHLFPIKNDPIQAKLL